MKKFPQYVFFVVIVLLFQGLSIQGAAPSIWRPISPAELAMDKPQVDKDADAEAIFWEVRLDDKKRKKLSYDHYVRVKIFTERGREKFAKFDIPFFKGKTVKEVAARVIKPDGTIVELKPQDIFEREIVRQRKIKIKAKSFAVPGIAPGVIVEYQYREEIKGDSVNGERLLFQRDIPLQRVDYFVRPHKKMNLRYTAHNFKFSGFRQAPDGFHVATMKNIPALKEEPRMPPDDEIRRWVYLRYSSLGFYNSWSFAISSYGRYFSQASKPDKRIKRKVAQLTSNLSNPEEKLRRIYDFAQNEITNVSFKPNATNGKKLKIKKASDVLKRGMGDARDIDMLFASMARAAGLSTSLAFVGNRNVNFFNPNKDTLNSSSVNPGAISVVLNDRQHYFNPGIPYLPFGKLIWYEEGVHTKLVSGSWNTWTQTPLSTPEQSRSSRKGIFKLTEEGVLEGTVNLKYTGNTAVARKSQGFRNTHEKRTKEFEEALKGWVSNGEFTDISIDNFDSSQKILTYKYRLRIPDYAKKTGSRMFLQPSVFKYNIKPEFSSETRIHPIYFRYPWSEVDEIEIELPKNFAIERFSVPTNVREKSKLGELVYDVNFNKESNKLIFKRSFYFGGGNRILFPQKAYTPLKKLFDLFHQSDSYVYSLKRKKLVP